MEILKLRPHHLLCTRAFKGKGYSHAFVCNMIRVIEQLKTNCIITLVEGSDAVCSNCPERIGKRCRSEEKINRFDGAVLDYIHLEKKNYRYAEVERILAVHLTESAYNSICSRCEWKATGVCCYADVQRPLLRRK